MMFTLVLAAFAAEVGADARSMDLSWSAEATELRYRFDTSMKLASERVDMGSMGSVGLDAELDMSCVPSGQALGLACLVLDATVRTESDNPELRRRAAHAELSLTGAFVDIARTLEGRVVAVDVRTGKAMLTAHGAMARTIVDLSVAGLDLELPGAVAGPTAWSQRRSALLPETTASSPLARVGLIHRAQPADDGLVAIETRGEMAWLQNGSAFAQSHLAKGSIVGETLFDADRGVMLKREWTARVPGAAFVQVGSVELLSME